MKTTRREALVTIAGIASVSPADAQTGVFTPAELDQVKAIVDAIIPRTDTPGASDAGVPVFIERRLSANPQMTERFRAGLKDFDGFADLSQPKQLAFLNARAADPFVRMIKGLTIDGYYASHEGLAEELGWHGNTFLPEFKGCTHPEHQQ